jgi:hypothetical protein
MGFYILSPEGFYILSPEYLTHSIAAELCMFTSEEQSITFLYRLPYG